MCVWILLPVSLPVITITGMWLVYVMALYNQHVCPINNWLYNESCAEPLPLQSGPVLCCTLDSVPLISKCGTLPPESCFFSLTCSAGSFMVMLISLLRFAQVTERQQNCFLNMAALGSSWTCAAGIMVLGNFQVDLAKVLHYVGAGVAFPCSAMFVCVQAALTCRAARARWEVRVGRLRAALALLALPALLLSGVFFCQRSAQLQHAAAILEWFYCSLVMLFYGTFAFEFNHLSAHTLLVLTPGGGAQDFLKGGGGGDGQSPSARDLHRPVTGP